MTAKVLHRRPAVSTDRIKTSLSVAAPDWLAMADAANWINGHGGQPVPFSAVTTTLTSGSFAVQATCAFSKAAVAAVVFATFHSEGDAEVTVQVSATGMTTTSQTVHIYGGTYGANAHAKMTAPLTSHQTPSTPRLVTVSFTWVSGTVSVMGYGIHEETRALLDENATDYGVDALSLHARRSIADYAQASAGGLIEAYKNMDARRSGYYSASFESGTGLKLSATTQTDILTVHVPMLAPIRYVADTQLALTVTFKAQTDTGTATLYLDTDEAGDSVSTAVDTSTVDYSLSVNVDAEDFSIADGRRGNAWEGLRVSYAASTGTELTLFHLTVLRTFRPI